MIVVFYPAGPYIRYTSILCIALGVILLTHLRHDRTVEIWVFGVLLALAVSLFTLRKELIVDETQYTLGSIKRWLAFGFGRVTVKVMPKVNSIYLDEERLVHQTGKSESVWLELSCDGQLLEGTERKGPHVVFKEHWPKRRERVVEIAQLAAEALNVNLVDRRERWSR
jgi:hypothetical protein